jgi:hypothetical protein
MSKSRKGILPEGKLTFELLGPILDSMPTDGLPVSNRVGMDAGIVQMVGKQIFSYSGATFGSAPGIAEDLVANLILQTTSLGKALVINPIALFPVGTNVEVIRRVLTSISRSAKAHGIIVGKGHTEITSRVNEVTLIATLLGAS